MKIFLLIFLLCSAFVNAEKRDTKFELTLHGVRVLHGIDTSLTMYAAGKYGDTFVEYNPFLQPLAHKPAMFGTVKFLMAEGSELYFRHLHRSHPKLAFWLSLANNAALSYVVAKSVHRLQIGPD